MDMPVRISKQNTSLAVPKTSECLLWNLQPGLYTVSFNLVMDQLRHNLTQTCLMTSDFEDPNNPEGA